MFKNSMTLEVKKNERDYVLMLPDDCNLGEVVDVLFDMRALAMSTLQQIIEKEKTNQVSKPEEIQEVN